MLPIAERFGADTYLMGGEISDTHLYGMAKAGAEDGRPMVVLTLSDADPAGHHMPTTIAWKLGALRDGWFPGLEFEVHPIAFLPEQVHAINAADPDNPLPSTPLKPGEKRAPRWLAEFGIEQTELDSIATLRPDVLRKLVIEGIVPFYDLTLDHRSTTARKQWELEAQVALEAQLGPEVLVELRSSAESKLEEIEEAIAELNAEMWVDADGYDLPPLPDLPAPELNGTPSPLASSEMGPLELVRRLKARGDYGT